MGENVDKILIKRGTKEKLEKSSPLSQGELFLARDEERLYVGGPKGNIPIATQKEVNEKYQEVSTQLDQMVNIDLASFGAVADANYFNEADNRYYKDKELTIPATDNAHVFQKVFDYMRTQREVNNNEKFTILFPRGAMYSSKRLELVGEYIQIIGNNSKLVVSVPNSDAQDDSLCLYVRRCREFRMSGMTIEHIIEDKSITSERAGRYYHLWIREDENVKLEYCHIHNNVFVDKISTPNTTVKPYNGIIWLNYAKNIFIHDNVFENPCGRIVYLFGCEKGFIRNNSFNNVGYLDPTITNTRVGSLAVRLLSCKDIVVSDNVFEFTESPYNAPEMQGVVLDSSDSSPTTPSENILVTNNIFILHNELTTAILCRNAINSKISGNTFILNDKGKWVTFRARSNDQKWDVELENNLIIQPPIDNQINIDIISGLDMSNYNAVFKNNRFKSDKLITKLSTVLNLHTLSSFRFENRNSFYQNGVYKFDYSSTNTLDYNQTPNIEVIINNDNVSDYIVDGVLDIPENVGLVRLQLDNVSISDIKFNGSDLQNKKITIFNEFANHNNRIVFSLYRMRLVGLKDYVFKPFERITLVFRSPLWLME